MKNPSYILMFLLGKPIPIVKANYPTTVEVAEHYNLIEVKVSTFISQL